MLRILHISDLHFGPPYLPNVGESLLRSAAELSVDLIVASGDFTQRAKPAQFAEARAWLECLPRVPIVVVPGNHDIPLYRIKERLLTPYDLYRKFISPNLDSVLRLDGAIIVALNTTDPLRRITEGRITDRQLEFCDQEFRDVAPGTIKIVVAHHPFARSADYDHSKLMHGTKRVLDRFNDLGVELILGGHLHRAYIGNSLDVNPSNDRTSGIIVVQSGTSTSRRGRAREREKNSFNVVRLNDTEVHVSHHMYFHEFGGFQPVSRHVFPRRQRHFLGQESGIRGQESEEADSSLDP